MTQTTDSLDRLARLYGVEPGYTDAWGNQQHVPEATKRALLAAMGVAVADDAEVAASLREAEAHSWRRMVPPACVVTPPERAEIAVTLPDTAAASAAAIEWRLIHEAGEVHRGGAALDDLPVVERATLAGGEAYQRRRLALPADTFPLGYHRLEVAVAGAGEGATSLIVAPPRCFGVDEAAAGQSRPWGFAAQLYGVRSERNWGMGDFTDVRHLAEATAGLGAAVLGLNPLHALFPSDPRHISPYSPSSRLFLNVLYIDPEAVPDFGECPEARAMVGEPGFRAELEAARAAELVDYPAVARLKRPVLEHLYASFRARHLDGAGGVTARGEAFRAFQREAGRDLARHALFDALHEHFLGQEGGAWSWHEWPAPYRSPESPEVAAFARERRDRVEFFAYLQWLADAQLGDAQEAACAAGMPLGLYQDLAVAVNPAGAMTWGNPGVSLTGVGVGAPPDIFSPLGQNWGLAPLSPVGLRESAYAAFIAGVRRNMRHAGAVRIDHAMGLQRLFWIPEGVSPADGAYVRYPFEDLVGIIALESHRQRCAVIGEDLGTVPEGFRPAMRRTGVLSCCVLYFERGEGSEFLPPDAYPEEALVSVSTHDLPTLRGYWLAHDVEWRERLNLFPDAEAAARAREERSAERPRLLHALARAGLLPPGIDPESPPEELTPELVLAVHRFLAATPGALLMIQLEDALGEIDQPNLPGTTDEHPNWRRKLPLTLERLANDPTVRRLAETVRAARGAAGPS